MPISSTDNITHWCYFFLEEHYNEGTMPERATFREKLQNNDVFQEYATILIEAQWDDYVQCAALVQAMLKSINWDTLIEYLDERVLYDDDDDDDDDDEDEEQNNAPTILG
jgi:hypothetical protein